MIAVFPTIKTPFPILVIVKIRLETDLQAVRKPSLGEEQALSIYWHRVHEHVLCIEVQI